jgi:hypothetical protein
MDGQRATDFEKYNRWMGGLWADMLFSCNIDTWIMILDLFLANASLKKYMYVSTLKIRNLPFNNIFQFLLNYNKNNMDFIYLFSISCLYKMFRKRSNVLEIGI